VADVPSGPSWTPPPTYPIKRKKEHLPYCMVSDHSRREYTKVSTPNIPKLDVLGCHEPTPLMLSKHISLCNATFSNIVNNDFVLCVSC
jgi:hypothetical protein